MRTRGSYLRLPLAIFSIFATLPVIVLNQTDLGNWLKKSDFAEWAHNIEHELELQNAEVLHVDFGTVPDGDDEFFAVVEIAEPSHEYELERLFADVQRIIMEAYLKTERVPRQPDTIAAIMRMGDDIRIGVLVPFEDALNYAQTGSGYDAFVETWQYVLDFGEDFEVEE